MPNALSRRNFLTGRFFAGASTLVSTVFKPLAAMEATISSAIAAQTTKQFDRQLPTVVKTVFVVARHCLAYQNSFCSVCREHCPMKGAIKIENGRPFIVADQCTACGICSEVCPAPTNAILMLESPAVLAR